VSGVVVFRAVEAVAVNVAPSMVWYSGLIIKEIILEA